MTLRPDETVQKILISSTCAFIAEYETEGLLVTHAWPNFHDRTMFDRRSEGPNSRSGYMVCFRTAPLIREAGVQIPDYGSYGDVLAAQLSLLFGKRFDNHGGTEATGSFYIPDLTALARTCTPELPQNRHKPRVDYTMALDFREIYKIKPLLFWRETQSPFFNNFHTALKFYHQALKNAEIDYEIAYLNLITAGEVLSNAFDYDKDALLDDQIKAALATIETALEDGPNLVRTIKGRLLQIRKRFVRTICDLVEDDFFLVSEVEETWGALKKNNFEQTIGAAYDLRSRYVHTGISFGGWIGPANRVTVTEVQWGDPQVSDPDFRKILRRAPTYVGLERIIRYCLLRYVQKNGALLTGPIPADKINVSAVEENS